MLSAGTYFGKVASGVTSMAKTGNSQLVVTVTVTHRAEDGQWVQIDVIERRLYLSCSPRAWPYTSQKLRVLGFNGDFRDPKFSDAAMTEGVELTCSHERYNDELSEVWSLAHWGSASEIERAPDAKLNELNERWRTAAIPDSSQTATATPPAETPATPSASSKTTAPPPSGAAPPTNSPADAPPATPKVSTREEAWTALGLAWGSTKSRDELADLWRELIAERKNREDQFTAADWQAVAEAAQIPF